MYVPVTCPESGSLKVGLEDGDPAVTSVPSGPLQDDLREGPAFARALTGGSHRSADEGSEDSVLSPRELQHHQEALLARSAKFKEQLAEEEALRKRLEALQKKAAEAKPEEPKDSESSKSENVPTISKEKPKDKEKENEPISPKTLSEASPTSPSPTSPGKGKGKAPGKAPPPKKGKGKGPDMDSALQPRMPEVKPRKAMKKLYWNPLKLGNGFSSTVWDFAAQRFEQGGSFFDMDELEDNFAEAGSCGGASPQRPRAQKRRRVLDEKRRRQLWFMLALMPERAQLLEAVASMDDEQLKPEKVELLQMNLPMPVDLQLIESSLKAEPLAEGELWDAPEEFVLALSSIPLYSLRVRVWGFLNSIDWARARILTAHEELTNAARKLKESPKVEQLLALILFVGNYLNGGTSRGRADGFDLEALPKLAKLRGKGQGTLLDFVVSQAATKLPGLLEGLFAAAGESEVVHRARAHRVPDLLEELKTLIGQAEGFLQEAQDGAPSPEDAQEASHWKALSDRQAQVEQSLAELRDALGKFGEWDKLYDEVCAWFSMQDNRQRSSDEFFALWESFFIDLKKARGSYQREQLASLRSSRSASLPPRRRHTLPNLEPGGSKTPTTSPRVAPRASPRLPPKRSLQVVRFYTGPGQSGKSEVAEPGASDAAPEGSDSSSLPAADGEAK
eukprot:s1040_g2.t1